jgi:hypothetical protein
VGWIRDLFVAPENRVDADVVASREEPVPLEGTRMDLFNSIIPNWFAENGMSSGQYYGTADLSNRVWVANRCQQLVAQAIGAMPILWEGQGTEPQWVSNPDPVMFPNGIGDAVQAIWHDVYGWGYSIQYVTSRYADGYPRTWTVVPASACTPAFSNGLRVYKMPNDTYLNPDDVIQIDRNSTTAAHGTSALRAYAQNAWSLLAAGDQSMSVSQGGIPQSVLKSERKLTKEQAEALQEQWMTATSSRNGAPPVLPPELTFEVLSINPSDLALLETQQWNAMVIATAYGVPGPMLNMALSGGLTYQNPIALMQMWWLTELHVMSKRLMDAWTARLLPRGHQVTQDATDMTVEGSIEASDDPQAAASNVAKVSPAQQPGGLTAIGGGRA